MSVQAHFCRSLKRIRLGPGRVGSIGIAARRLAGFCHSEPGIRQYTPHVFFQYRRDENGWPGRKAEPKLPANTRKSPLVPRGQLRVMC